MGITGLWYPYKHEQNVNSQQVLENGITELSSGGPSKRLLIAQKKLGQDLPVVIENSTDYFKFDVNPDDGTYYEKHLLIDEYKYYVFVELCGATLNGRSYYELSMNNGRLSFNIVKDKKIWKKIRNTKNESFNQLKFRKNLP